MKPTPEMIDIGMACFGVNFKRDSRDIVDRIYETMDKLRPPIPIVLYCPVCGTQHIDAPEECPDEGCPHYGTPHGHPDLWDNPPHRSHLCSACGYVWRPADMCTTGVTSIETKGSADSVSIAAWLASPEGKRKIDEALARSYSSIGAAEPTPPVPVVRLKESLCCLACEGTGIWDAENACPKCNGTGAIPE